MGDVLGALVHEAEAAGGEVGVAAALCLGGALEHQHARAILMRGDCSAESGIAGTGHHDIVFSHGPILSVLGHVADARLRTATRHVCKL